MAGPLSFIEGLTLDMITWFSKGDLSGFKFVPTEWLGNLVKVLDNLCMAVRYTWLGTHNVRRLQCCSSWIDARLYVFHLYCIWSKSDVICWTCVGDTVRFSLMWRPFIHVLIVFQRLVAFSWILFYAWFNIETFLE